MDRIIPFEIGCRKCGNLCKIGKSTYLCSAKVHMDDSEVIPVRDGQHTTDWYICNGDSYCRRNVV